MCPDILDFNDRPAGQCFVGDAPRFVRIDPLGRTRNNTIEKRRSDADLGCFRRQDQQAQNQNANQRGST